MSECGLWIRRSIMGKRKRVRGNCEDGEEKYTTSPSLKREWRVNIDLFAKEI